MFWNMVKIRFPMKALKALLLIPLIPVIILLAVTDLIANPFGSSFPNVDRLLNSILS